LIKEIEIKEVVKAFNNRFELNCSFNVRSEKIYVLMGPNGSGKSTLLRILALLERPDRGSIVYKAEKVYVNPFSELAFRRRIVLVSTTAMVFNDTVLGNVIYGLKIRGLTKREAKKKALVALERVGLEQFKDENATVLSSGQRQRLSLARALAIEPEILLLDEPTTNLDPENTKIIENAIISLSKNTKMLIVFVTHNIFQAKRLSDEVIFMYNGKVLEQSSRDDFFSEPKTEIAMRFITGQLY